MYYLLMLLGYLLTFLVVKSFLPGVVTSSLLVMVISALALTLLSLILRPLLLVILLPINLLTMGLFSLLINTWMVMLVDKMVSGLSVGGFINAMVTALIGMLFMYLLRSWYQPDLSKQ